MKQKQCQAIILHNKLFFESDKRLECFSPTLGKFTCLAKSAAKKASKTGKSYHPLSLVNLHLFQGRSFLIVTQCDIITHFNTIHSSFNHLHYALFFISIIQKSVDYNQPNSSLFTLFLNTLKDLNSLLPVSHVALTFYEHYLKIEGIHPEAPPQNENHYLKLIRDYVGYPLPKPLQLDESMPYPVK
ncbi:DNA repair protein RecO [Candidatus Marinamargulisbacteria bacterium SCGC AG-343-D04]|nr:DNA repair protein RecO [Candidatus Marinamargulisbacteria bacterium SCGC AG-343-D04]